VAIPVDRNVTQEIAEKELKYKSLCTEMKRMGNMARMRIPLINGATGVVIKDSKKILDAIPEKH
jgi:hypothetical protein